MVAAPKTKLADVAPAPVVAAKEGPKVLYVLDTTAVRTSENASGNRQHEQIVDGAVRSYTFEPGKPLPLPPAVALKFLRHEAFKLTDETGKILAYRRRPKQPGELEAGETLKLTDDQTVALYDELSTDALRNRVLEMPNSDRFASREPSRKAMIAFLVEHTNKVRADNLSRQPDTAPDEEFVPEFEDDEIAA